MRAPSEADAEAIAALFAGKRSVDAEEVRSWFRNPTFDVARDFRVHERDGSPVGYIDVHVEDDRLSVDWTALDAASGHALIDWATERAREEGVARLRSWAWDSTGELAGVLNVRRFVPVQTSLEMQVPLSDATPAPTWPEGVVVSTVREGEEPRVHALIEEAFADTNGFLPTPYGEWAAWALEANRLDRELWFATFFDDEIVAVARCEREHAGEPGLGWIQTLAVRRAWRRRGLGTALLLHAFRRLRAHGKVAAGLSVDAENPTGAVRLYESVGMRPVRTRAVYEKRLGD